MTKMTVELDLDWVDENMDISSTIKQELITRVLQQVAGPMMTNLRENTQRMVSEKIDEMAVETIQAAITEFMQTPKQVTDKFGDIVNESISPADILKKKINELVEVECVDERGRYAKGYSAKFTLFDWIVKQRKDNVEDLIDAQCKKAMDETKESIALQVEKKVKTNVADNLTKIIMENSTTLSLKDENGEKVRGG